MGSGITPAGLAKVAGHAECNTPENLGIHNPSAAGQAAHTPDYQELDTYDADLLNENPPRREGVTEIQDREDGHLLCYASPERAAFIIRACNNHAALVAALEDALEIINADEAGTYTELYTKDVQAAARAALAAAKGGQS